MKKNVKPERKILKGYKHIIDDGDCTDHGYFIPTIQDCRKIHKDFAETQKRVKAADSCPKSVTLENALKQVKKSS